MIRVVSLVLTIALSASAARPAIARDAPAPTAVPVVATASPADPDASPSPEASAAAPAASVSPSEVPAPSATPAPLALAKTKLQLNPGGSSTIAIAGGVPPYAVGFASATPPATGANATSTLGTATIDPIAQTLLVAAAPVPARGQAPPAGTTSLTVTDSLGSSVTLSLLVGPNAGFVTPAIPIALVGDPSQEYTSTQIDAAVRRATSSLAGAAVTVSLPEAVPTSIPAGQTVAIPVNVHIDGRGRYVDVDVTPTVQISGTAHPPVVPTTLFYSDDPENVNASGILFRGTVTAEKPARLYYYHQALTPGHQIAIVLDTPQGTADVTVIGHGAGPNPAVFFVGQNATYRYLDDHARGAGVDLDIPVGAPVIITAGTGPLNVRDLVAGVFDIAVRDGDPVRLTVLSYDSGVDPRTLLEGTELPSDGYRRRGEFDLALTTPIALAETLTGNAPATISEPTASPEAASSPDATTATDANGGPVAASTPATALAPVPEPTAIVAKAGSGIPNLIPGGRSLGGDYGVLHPVTLTLGNDTDAPGTLYLYEQPITGQPVTTSIDFDGDPSPMRLQCVKTRTNRYLVRAFTVQPHVTTTVTGTYMTDGGSTYPIVFGLTATQPSPLPVTMTEADGCFPKPQPVMSPSPAPPLSSPVPGT